MNSFLLHPSQGDHYCTQSDPSESGGVAVCTRDFVDYDANTIAVAARVPNSTALAKAILARVDKGTCTHAGRATYVSEIYYDKKDCVGGNTGDSAVAMGRIGWQDSLARLAIGDDESAEFFESTLLAPLQHDLLRRTWLPERFDCKGNDAHNAFYFEYSCTVALMLYEVRYGISIQMTKVIVNPLSARSWDYVGGKELHIGYYDGVGFHARLTSGHKGERTFIVSKMSPGSYAVNVAYMQPFNVSVAGDGVLTFIAPVGEGIVVDAVKI